MAVWKLKTAFQYRSFAVFRGTPVCTRKKKDAATPPVTDFIPEKPKKPHTAFITYLNKNKVQLKKEYPDASVTELVKLGGVKWKGLPQSIKDEYLSQYHKDCDQYINNMYKYYQERSKSSSLYDEPREEMKKIIKAQSIKMGKPSKPLNGFLIFATEYAKRSGKSFVIPNGIEEGKKKWIELGEAEREKYNLQAKRESEKYEEKMVIWEKKMLQDGHFLLVRCKTRKQFPDFTVELDIK